MKQRYAKIVIVLVLVFFPALVTQLMADPPGPPDPGGNPVGNGGVPVGAPIDSGIGILVILGLAYGAYKLYEMNKKHRQEEPAE
jgi:hypothetical protein